MKTLKIIRSYRFSHLTIQRLKQAAKDQSITQTQVLNSALDLYFIKLLSNQ